MTIIPPLSAELSFLTASASGPERVHASAWGPAIDAKARTTGRAELGGAVVVMTHDEQRPDETSFGIVSVFMRDPARDEILLYAFDSVGFAPDPPARGRWVEGTLVLERTSERGSGRTSFTPTATGFTWAKQFQATGDDQWHDVVSAILTAHH